MRFQVRRLDPDDAPWTYALARLAEPGLTLSDWEARLSQPERDGGVFAGFDDGAPRSLLTYVRAFQSDGGEILVIGSLAAFDLLRPRDVALRLIAGVRDRLRAQGTHLAWGPTTLTAADFDRLIAETACLHSVL